MRFNAGDHKSCKTFLTTLSLKLAFNQYVNREENIFAQDIKPKCKNDGNMLKASNFFPFA